MADLDVPTVPTVEEIMAELDAKDRKIAELEDALDRAQAEVRYYQSRERRLKNMRRELRRDLEDVVEALEETYGD